MAYETTSTSLGRLITKPRPAAYKQPHAIIVWGCWVLRRRALLLIHPRLQHTNVRQVAVVLAVVEAVAYHEFIGGGDADVIGLHVHCAALGLIEQGAELGAGGVGIA